MNIITWINLIANIIVLSYIAYRENRIYLSVERTFWCDRLIGINVMWNSYPVRKRGRNARGLFYIPIRNAEKTEEWDNKMFVSGEYKKYEKV